MRPAQLGTQVRRHHNILGMASHVPRHADKARAAETKAIHEVMELVRLSAPLNQKVLRLRDRGLSWRQVQAAIKHGVFK